MLGTACILLVELVCIWLVEPVCVLFVEPNVFVDCSDCSESDMSSVEVVVSCDVCRCLCGDK